MLVQRGIPGTVPMPVPSLGMPVAPSGLGAIGDIQKNASRCFQMALGGEEGFLPACQTPPAPSAHFSQQSV